MRRALLLAMGLAFPGVVATAQDLTVTKAQTYVDLATQLFKAGDFEGALAELRRAEPLLAGTTAQGQVRFNIARCLEELRRDPEAIAAYETFLMGAQDPKRAERAREAVARLERRAFGSLAIGCTPDSARLDIPSLDMVGASCPVEAKRAAPGRHAIRGRAPGYVPAAIEVEVHAGARSDVRITLMRELAPQRAPVLSVGTTPPPAPVDERPVLPWALMGGGAALLATGAVLHVLASGNRDEAEEMGPGARRSEKVSDFERQRALTISGYGLGVAAAAVGGWMLLGGSF